MDQTYLFAVNVACPVCDVQRRDGDAEMTDGDGAEIWEEVLKGCYWMLDMNGCEEMVGRERLTLD